MGTNASPELSIKCMFGGSARYVTAAGQHYVVDDDDFLVLGRGNAYTVEKDALRTVETFCLFFPADWVDEVSAAILATEDRALDDPFAAATLDFYEHRRPHRGRLSQCVLSLRRRMHAGCLSEEALAQELPGVIGALVCEHRSIRQKVSRLPWARASTRSELYRRVHVGRDYMHAHLAEPFSLTQAARAACMSRYHFLRTFRQIIGQTPLGYVQSQRLHRAIALLRRSTHSLTEIAAEIGFGSVGAFSSFFARQMGRSPSAWRKAHRNPQHR